MLDYEKKLHLDENWKKIQNLNLGTYVIQLAVNIITYVVLFLLLKWLLLYIQDMNSWNSSSVLFSCWQLSFKMSDIIYFIGGLIMYLYGTVRFIGICRQNKSVKDNMGKPLELITSGYYAKLRHPMYGVFIIRAFAILLSVRSLIGILLALLFAASQYINALREEKKILIPLFGAQYNEYEHIVKGMLLHKWEACVLFIWVLIGVLGLFI